MSRTTTMIIFLLTIFTLYGGLHAYIYEKISGAFPLNRPENVALITVLMFLCLAPFTIRISEHYGLDVLARALSYVGYLWMGFLFIFFSISFLFDIYRLSVTAGMHFSSIFRPLMPSPRLLLFLPALISLIVAVYGYLEAKNVRTEQIEIGSARLSEATGRVRIVQISDVHIGMIVGKKRLAQIAREVKQADPDLLISTGDLLDGQIDNLSECASILRDIQPRFGKVAIMGNHEYFAGESQSLSFMREAGFSMLRGEVMIAGGIGIAGLDDPMGKNFNPPPRTVAKDLLSTVPAGIFTLILAHQPIVQKESIGGFDLQLSGHTHKGQIFPFSLATRYFFPYHSGFFRLDDRSSLYVSRGTGTWGPPIRFLAVPEITIIDLIPGQDGFWQSRDGAEVKPSIRTALKTLS